MTDIKHISAVIFDMDGLVLDTEGSYFIAWQQAGEAMNYLLTDDFCQSLSGLHYKAVEKKIINLCGKGFDIQLFNQLSANFWHQHVHKHGIEVKKGLYDLLNFIQNNQIPFCLATNSSSKNAEECLKYAGLNNKFLQRVTRDDVKKAKPEPDIYLAAATKLKQPVEQCLVLEDSLIGIQAAVLAGTMPVYIPSVLPPEQQAIDLSYLVADDLLQIKEYLALI